MTDHDATRTEGEGETLDMPEGMQPFIKGQVLGERYQVMEMLGRGGMGEVWHAFDLKLRVEVALKALRPEFFKSERRLELLRQEVRAAREVMSPNVCRIFDLVEVDGRELVSMEYVDGATLLEVLQERGPLDLKEAQDIASQFLAGLEAIHKVGLIHRDIKPENIMLTRAGRVVVMDFGLARQETEGGGTVAGTPAYMAPEQAAGQTLDARADVYAAGVVLAEMVSPEGIKSFESRQSVWEGVRSEPAKLPDSPWAPVIQQAVKKDREGRFNSAHTLTRALEDVTLRVEGADDLHPYPGLASFTESDAEYFFGREAEVEQMWRKLEGPPRMLGLVGPSGAGKSSFIGAGVLANAPPGWDIMVSTPGNVATSSLGRVVARTMGGDPNVAEKMMDFQDPDVAVEVLSHWSRQNDRVLLVVDQFEELFTQNAIDEQTRFAELLERLVLEADIHVVLSMRDDFLMQCRDQDPLRPIFADMTAIPSLSGAGLRRALVQPATKCGYRFEDDALVDEMLAEVEGERGALPLLAFAAARLWEIRDRETGLLTRQAYHDIGGGGGALAQHAEATIDRIGVERIPIVRELFRNLVTADGTRAVREWNELLSIFDEAQLDSAKEVLHRLIDARLLTSYEVREDGRDPTRRVEIIHESLLANWPRLVRWQTQDVDGAQLRDEMRQASRAWDEHGRSEDRLWTGTAFREFRLWRERYPGRLTELEEAFAIAMTTLATRRKRRRRLAAAVGTAVLLIVLAVVTGLWRRSVLETRRAEASKLVTLGELELEDYPTATLAWATASLELADTQEARVLATRALSAAPPVTILFPTETAEGLWRVTFSDSGEWFAGRGPVQADLWHQSGRSHALLNAPFTGKDYYALAFAEDDTLLTDDSGTFRWWSVHDVDQPVRIEETSEWLAAVRGDGFFSYSASQGVERIQWWPTVGGEPRPIGSMEPWHWQRDAIDATGSWLAYPRANGVWLRSLVDWDQPPRVIGALKSGPGTFLRLAFHPDGDRVAAVDGTEEIHIWSTGEGPIEPVQTLNVNGAATDVELTVDGKWLGVLGVKDDGMHPLWLFDLEAPRGVRPLELLRTETGHANPDQLAVHPDGNWFVASTLYSAGFWPSTHQHPWVFDDVGRVFDVLFTPDGQWLLFCHEGGQISASPLEGQNEGRFRVLFRTTGGSFYYAELALHPSGDHVAVGSFGTHIVYLVPMDGGPVREFPYPDVESSGNRNLRIAFSPDGLLMAVVPTFGNEGGLGVQLWDLETGEDRMIGSVKGETASIRFIDQRRILWTGNNTRWEGGGEYLFDLGTDTVEILSEGGKVWSQALSADGSSIVEIEMGGDISSPKAWLVWRDLETGEKRPIAALSRVPWSVDLDPTGQWIATGDMKDGIVRVGPVSGEEPFLLHGHKGWVQAVAVSPDGRWIASGGDDGTLRIWPMPDLSKPPLHTLPHDELIAKLKTLTNLRVVREPDSSTGWKLTHDPFPGWETVPTW